MVSKRPPTRSIELAVPFRGLGVTTDQPVQFWLRPARATSNPKNASPTKGAIETVVPSPDYELMMWQA